MSDEKRRHILSTAWDVFFRYGYKRVNMKEIAEAAKISRPGLYLYFKTKEEVFNAAIMQYADSVIAKISEGFAHQKTIEDKILYAFDLWTVQRFDLTLSSPEAKEVSDSSHSFARETMDESYKKFEAILASALKTHAKSAGAKKILSADKSAHLLTSAVRGFKLSAKSSIELRKMIQDLVKLILAA